MTLAKNHADVLQVLIEHGGVVPRAWDFFMAVMDGHFETLQVLVRACPGWADLFGPEYTVLLAISINASPDDLEMTRFLINIGSPVNCIYEDQQTPLSWAAYSGNIEMVKLLLDRGADPDPDTPLWSLRNAAEQGHLKIAGLLLEKIDVQGKIAGGGDDRFWIIYSAAACGFEKIVRACLDAGCNANRRLWVSDCPFQVDETCRGSKGGYNVTPLDWARERGYSAVVRLLEHDANAV